MLFLIMTSSELYKVLSNHTIDRLPGEAAHELLSPLKKEIRSAAFNNNLAPRLSAVSILLYDIEDDPYFVLTRRHIYKGAHSGQISLPGGKQEVGDRSNLETALRETHEEVGIHPDSLELVCELTPTYIPPSGFLVFPFVLMSKVEPEFVLEEKEVKELLEIKVKDLIHPNNFRFTYMELQDGFKTRVPYFNLNGEIVWGATAMILNEFKEILIR